MIDRGDNIVVVSYPQRDTLGNERTDTYTFVGKPENISKLIANKVQRWLERGTNGPMTLHVSSPFTIVDADER